MTAAADPPRHRRRVAESCKTRDRPSGNRRREWLLFCHCCNSSDAATFPVAQNFCLFQATIL
jgi:hypothetical protein